MFKIFTCKLFSEAHSRSLDGELSPVERVRYKLHYFLCLYCRRFARQLRLIDNAAVECDRSDGLDTCAKLSVETKSRIKESFKNCHANSGKTDSEDIGSKDIEN